MAKEHTQTRGIWGYIKSLAMFSRSRNYYLLLWAIFGLSSLLFSSAGGWAYYCEDNVPDNICYIDVPTDSTGLTPNVDDGFDIDIGLLLAIIAVLWAIFRRRQYVGRGDLSVYGILLILQALFLTDLQLGSLTVTILRAHNIVLLVWMSSYALLCISTLAGAAVPSKWLVNRELAAANLANDNSGSDKPANYRPNRWVTAALSFLVPPLGMLNVAQPTWAAVYFFAWITMSYADEDGQLPVAVAVFLTVGIRAVAAVHAIQLALRN